MCQDAGGRVPHNPQDIDADWLTRRLRADGALRHGAVREVEVIGAAKWNIADIAYLKVDYSDDAAGDLPRGLFAKIGLYDDPLGDIFPGEFAFYAESPSGKLPVARCYAALRDEATGRTCLLLEDLDATHRRVDWPLPPNLADCEGAVKALARLHANWWRAGGASGDLARADMLANDRRLVSYFRDIFPKFREDLGDRLAPERARIIDRTLEALLGLKERRISAPRPVTRVHSDAHLWNVMYPRDAATHDCVFIDWEDWRTDFGAADLAYMIALHWYPDRRSRYEDRLLATYLAALEAAGVTGYTMTDLKEDYRLGLLQAIYTPIFQQQAGQAHGAWWSHLERWCFAFEDLGCEEML